MKLSVAIPTYGREQVLIDSIAALLALDPPPWELLVVDQTPRHEPGTEARLQEWADRGQLRLLRLSEPSVIAAMNLAIQEARGDRLLFLDDDIIPGADLLVNHARAGEENPEALIAGRVLQPWHRGEADREEQEPFLCNTLRPRACLEFIGCNFSFPRRQALELGGFDANFLRVAYRYEAEFAHRWRLSGRPLLYEPRALIHHLRAERGGTRSYGEHLRTARPDHAVGRYYFRLRTQSTPAALKGSLDDLLRSVRTRHHLRRPWWIPLTLLAEGSGWLWALRLHRRGPALIPPSRPRLLIAGSHPVQYHSPLFQVLAQDPALDTDVLYLTLPGADTQGLGFGVSFTWDVPLLSGYRWHEAGSGRGRGITSGYAGVWLRHPLRELGVGPLGQRPDAILLTGWHFLGMVQLFLAARLRRIPVLLRMDSNDFRPRSRFLALAYWLLFRGVSVGLTVGKANARLYRANGIAAERLIPSPHYVDNDFFSDQADALRPRRTELRREWGIPPEAFCFLFAGKLQDKKRPLDLLSALHHLRQAQLPVPPHLLIVGTGHLEEACRAEARRHGLAVSFAGFLNQSAMPSAYAVSDCLLLPSDHGESWGLVVNEAMACGLPAIVSDLAGCAEDLVLGRGTGVVVPCGDTTALARAMETMAGDPAAAAAMGSRARALVQAEFTIHHAAEGIRRGVALALCR